MIFCRYSNFDFDDNSATFLLLDNFIKKLIFISGRIFTRWGLIYAYEQGYSHGAAAASLGVSGTNISRWVIEREREPAGGKNKQSISSEQAELEQLRKENKRLRMEREILKKAAAFFANETQ